MALNNSQYNSILRLYDAKQFNIRRNIDERTAEIYKRIPQFKALDEEIVNNSVKCTRQNLLDTDTNNNKMRLKELKKANLLIMKKKEELLLEHGYPKDYLSPDFECKDCKDTGFIDGKRCHCFNQAVINLLYSESLINNALNNENFSTFRYDYYSDEAIDPALGITPYENINKVLDKCHSFVNSFDSEYQKRVHKNLLIYGNTGVGKTFLANCIAKEILDKGHSVVYITASELFETLGKNSFDRRSENSYMYSSKADYINTCELLIIDDLGTEL
ncbi:MAG: ATP-binding protein, partial [Lachnospiraceae bacterium]|nr:ATP-binding protein [Lachnospiraceae bacterium]